jgi:hypothetical protein
MNLIQIYETTISDAAGRLVMTCLVLPARSLVVNDRPAKPEQVRQALDLKELKRVSPSALPYALGSLLAANEENQALQVYQTLLESPMQKAQEVLGPDILSFSESACFEELIPFENSPLEPAALASLVKKASTTALGAYIGFVAVGPSPLLFISVPAGIIICGAAGGAGAGLKTLMEEGVRKIGEDVLGVLRSRILKWLTRSDNNRATKKTKRPVVQRTLSEADLTRMLREEVKPASATEGTAQKRFRLPDWDSGNKTSAGAEEPTTQKPKKKKDKRDPSQAEKP